MRVSDVAKGTGLTPWLPFPRSGCWRKGRERGSRRGKGSPGLSGSSFRSRTQNYDASYVCNAHGLYCHTPLGPGQNSSIAPGNAHIPAERNRHSMLAWIVAFFFINSATIVLGGVNRVPTTVIGKQAVEERGRDNQCSLASGLRYFISRKNLRLLLTIYSELYN